MQLAVESSSVVLVDQLVDALVDEIRLMKAKIVLHSRGDVEDVAVCSHSDDKPIECP